MLWVLTQTRWFFFISQEPNFCKTFKFCCNQSQVNKYQGYIQNPAKHLTMRFFAKITIFAKTSILHVWQGSEYALKCCIILYVRFWCVFLLVLKHQYFHRSTTHCFGSKDVSTKPRRRNEKRSRGTSRFIATKNNRTKGFRKLFENFWNTLVERLNRRKGTTLIKF